MLLLSTAFCPPVEYLALMARDVRILDDPGRSVAPSAVWLEACEAYQKQSWRNRCRILTADGPRAFSFPVTHPAVGEAIRSVKVDYSTGWVTHFERTLSAAYDSSPFFAYYSDSLFSLLRSRPERLFDLNIAVLRWLLSCLHLPCELRLTESFLPAGEEAVGVEDGERGAGNMDVLKDMAGAKEVENAGKVGYVQNLGGVEDTENVDGTGEVRDLAGAGTAGDAGEVRDMAGVKAAAAARDVEDYRFAIHPKRPNDILARLGLGQPYWQVFSGRYGFVPGLSSLDLLFNLGPDALPHLKKLP